MSVINSSHLDSVRVNLKNIKREVYSLSKKKNLGNQINHRVDYI